MANICRVCPYARFDGFSTTGVPRAWKLENDWIAVWVASEIGGKV